MVQYENILSIRHINKTFPGVKALDDVELEVRKGEVHALLGENGAGKSTLVKIIVGAYQKDDGTILFKGQPCAFQSPGDAYHSGLSIIYQETSLIPQLSILQNIFLGMEPTLPGGIIDTGRILREYERVCQQVGFHFNPHRHVKELSVAEQKMVEILKAMVHQASFIIMDEPTDSLADAEIRHLFKIIRDLKRQQMTILYITHYLDEVFEITDRLTVLRDGKHVTTVKTGEVTTREVVKMMIGQELVHSSQEQGLKKKSREALRVEHLSRKQVVSDVSFRAYEGEILGITGVIGAGKTELARAIFGADPYESGKIFVNGSPCRLRSPVDAVKLGIGMLPEDRKHLGLLLDQEVYKNITLSAINRFISGMVLSKADELRATHEIIERLDIKVASPHQSVKYLSGGNQQKIVIGKWLTAMPKILIMDEPTRGIDVGSKHEVYKIVKQLAEEGTCIIFISSEVLEIIDVADRILVMRKGTIAAQYHRGVTQKEIMQAMLEGTR